MVVRGEECGCLWGEGGRCSGRLGESGCIGFIGDDIVQGGECAGFAASMRACCWFEAKLRHGGDGEIMIGAGEKGIRGFCSVTLDAVDVGVLGRPRLLEVKRQITGIWK